MKILIAEDQPPAALFLRRMLETMGHEVVVAPDGEAAWQIVRDGNAPILISDWMMPRLDGLDLCRRIRAAGGDRYTYVILLTSRDRREDRLEGLRAGADDFLTKPPYPDEIALRVEIAERILAVHDHLARRNLQLAHQARHDELTGLPNRSHLQHELERRLNGRSSANPFALLLIDLDRFKEINDALGHHYGDLLLQAIAPRLRDVIGDSGIAARIGGDEFGILVPGADGASAVRVAESVLAALRQPIVIKGRALDVGASIGVALCPGHADDPIAMLQCADIAMYAAKRNRVGCLVYAAERPEFQPVRVALIGELRRGIEQNQLLLHYQPKINLRTRAVEGVEALVRWLHPREGLLPPSQFIELAEETGLIKPLSLWTLQTALLQCRVWRQEGSALNVAVNLAADVLREPDLLEMIVANLQISDTLPGWLTLEITESAVMADPKSAKAMLGRLRGMGVRIAIDDFGTGYSSLGYLRDLPVDEIKIDRSFVQRVTSGDPNASIVRSVIDLGRNLGLKVVAEGAEDKETVELLESLGCDYVQGFYFSKPLAPADFAAWLARSQVNGLGGMHSIPRQTTVRVT
ncbi:MAG TPA: EAL domain-containing protein [Isosphaeraceae bacterium]|nr:EAL domain-containing protein [Isosphaeraceae bacterium]